MSVGDGAVSAYRAAVTPGLPPEAEAHYRFYDEDDRLDRHWIERVRTQAVLDRVLPEPPLDVLDVGGGTGVHSAWLAERGHRVTLVDAMAEHVDQAGARVGSRPWWATPGPWSTVTTASTRCSSSGRSTT